MCNTCNFAYANNALSSGLNGGGILNFLFGSCRQSICRDCYGNIRVTNASNSQNYGCGWRHSCGCCHSCGCSGNANNSDNASTGVANGNGFSCFTVCGNNGVSASSQNSSLISDAYYARQYGLSSNENTFSYSRGCNCGLSVY